MAKPLVALIQGGMAAIVITGASMGIGRELAVAWAKRGRTLVLSARSKEGLSAVADEVEQHGGRARLVPGDVTDSAYRTKLIEQADGEGGIGVLINNAGRGYYASIPSIEADALRELFELNVFAPLALTQLALPSLRRTKGTVVMLSSVAGVVAAPRYGAYAASKFALEGLSMAMRAELAQDGVRVVVVRPGPVDTPFRQNAVRGKAEPGYTRPDPKAQSAQDVAERCVRAVERGSPIDETSSFVRLASAVSRFSPPILRLALRRMAGQPPPA